MSNKLSVESGMRILRRHAEGDSVRSIAQRQNITVQAVYWWLQYAGLNKEWLKKVKAMEHRVSLVEGRYSRLSNKLRIATSVIKRLQTSPKRRALLATAVRAEYHIPQSVANMIVGIGPNAGTSKSAVAADKVLIATMRKHIELNPGRGFKGMFANFLRDEPGTRYNALRLYAENLKPRRRVAGKTAYRSINLKHMDRQERPDRVWSIDFMQDVLCNGEKFWLVNVIDDFSREALVVRAVKRRSAKIVIELLGQLVDSGRIPRSVRSDNGGEFKSLVYKSWTDRARIRCIYSRPYTPTDNAYIESFNRSVRMELLSRYKYRTLAELQRSIDDWRIRYNFARPHTSLGGLSPLQFVYVFERDTSSAKTV